MIGRANFHSDVGSHTPGNCRPPDDPDQLSQINTAMVGIGHSLIPLNPA